MPDKDPADGIAAAAFDLADRVRKLTLELQTAKDGLEETSRQLNNVTQNRDKLQRHLREAEQLAQDRGRLNEILERDVNTWKSKAEVIRLDPIEQENTSLKLKVRSLKQDLEDKAILLNERQHGLEHYRQNADTQTTAMDRIQKELAATIKERDKYEATLSGRVEDYFNYVATNMYQYAKDHGFHEGDEKFPTIAGLVEARMSEYVANIHGEVSELWEAYRKDEWHKPCDKKINGKPIGLTCAEEELADISIRAMDVSVTMNINLGRAIRIKSEYNKQRPWRHGNKKA